MKNALMNLIPIQLIMLIFLQVIHQDLERTSITNTKSNHGKDEKTKEEKVQHDTDREAAKILILSSDKINKYENQVMKYYHLIKNSSNKLDFVIHAWKRI